MLNNDLSFHIEDINRATTRVKIVPDKSYFSSAVKRTEPYKSLPYMFKPVLEKIGDHVRTQLIPRTFKNEGPGWAPLARRTQRERIQEGHLGQHPILRRSGDLYRELTEKTHPNHIEIIKTGKYARIELGGSSEKFIQNQMGKGIAGQRLPQRSMIPGAGNVPLLERDRREIKNIVDKAIRDKLGVR